MAVRLEVENYRVLRKIAWELPKGVCALVGPNGCGKTTLLELIEVLRDILANGVGRGLEQHGTSEGFRNFHASGDERVRLALVWDGLRWALDFGDAWGPGTYDEVILQDQALVSELKRGSDKWAYRGKVLGAPQETAFRQFAYEPYGGGAPQARLLPPTSYLADYRLYRPYHLDPIRVGGSKPGTANVLLASGHNIFSVLRNWRDRRASKERYEFVVEALKDAFPDIFDELELESTLQTVIGRVFAPGSRESLPISYAPSGLLTGILHLAAVASTEPGGIVAIDEPENGLHPYAVKRILAAVRAWADDKDLTVLLATHSPMLIDQFKEDPEHLYVMEPGREVLPVRLDQVRDRDWLAQFSLGDLYKAGDFGAPAEGAAA